MPEIGQASFKEASVASAATANIGTTDEWLVNITGTTTITSFGTSANRVRFLRFSDVLTLTHNGTTLKLPGSADITTAAGDTAIASSDDAGNWAVRAYQPANGQALIGPSSTDILDSAALGRSILTNAVSGAWTPDVYGSATPGTQTFSWRSCRYSLVGDLCFLKGNIRMSGNSGGAGIARIGPLPFAAANVANFYQTVAIAAWGQIALSAGAPLLTARVDPAGTYLNLLETTAPGAADIGVVSIDDLGATTEINIDGYYFV
jgi:hypothetical protein